MRPKSFRHLQNWKMLQSMLLGLQRPILEALKGIACCTVLRQCLTLDLLRDCTGSCLNMRQPDALAGQLTGSSLVKSAACCCPAGLTSEFGGPGNARRNGQRVYVDRLRWPS